MAASPGNRRKRRLSLRAVYRDVLTPGGRYIVRREDLFVEIRDGRTGKIEHKLPEFTSPIAATSIAGNLLLTATVGGQIDLWRLDTGSIVYRQRHGHRIKGAALAADQSEYSITNGNWLYIYPVPRFTANPGLLVDRLRQTFDADTFRQRYIVRPEHQRAPESPNQPRAK